MKGSVAIFPQGCSHTMYSRLDAPPVHLLRILNPEQVGGLSTLEYGGHGEKTQFICGYLLCDQRFNPLLGTVPDVLILSPLKRRKKCLRKRKITGSGIILCLSFRKLARHYPQATG